MVYDGNLILQTTVATTASTNSAALDMETTPGTGRPGLAARVRILSQNAPTPGATIYFQLQESADTTTWLNLKQSYNITPTTATSTNNATIDLPFNMTQRYLRLQSVYSATTGAPTVTYASEIGFEFPG